MELTEETKQKIIEYVENSDWYESVPAINRVLELIGIKTRFKFTSDGEISVKISVI